MAKIMAKKYFSFTVIVILSISVIAVLFLGWVAIFTDFFNIDRCLDQAGCWDEVDSICRKHETNAQELCLRKKD